MGKALVDEREQEERGEPQTVWPDTMQRRKRLGRKSFSL